MAKYGWKLDGEAVSVTWESEKNLDEVKKRVAFYISGCGCNKGQAVCTSSRCGCVCNARLCGPACKCPENVCKNIELSSSLPVALGTACESTPDIFSTDESDGYSEEEELEVREIQECETDHIMQTIFDGIVFIVKLLHSFPHTIGLPCICIIPSLSVYLFV